MALTLWSRMPKKALGIIVHDKSALVSYTFKNHVSANSSQACKQGFNPHKRIGNAAFSCRHLTAHSRLASQLKPNVKGEVDNVSDYSQSDSKSPSSDDRPSPEQLNYVFKMLSEQLPNLFIKSLDYNIYHPQIVFENNIQGKRTVGLYEYIKQISIVRIVGHLKFAYVRLDVLKITQHPEDSTVKVRWTIGGISGLKVIILFWKYRIWNMTKLFEKTIPWYDGFSTFYVNGEGKIYKHVADKMMPDMDREEASPTDSHIAAAKLSLLVGIIPKFST